MSHEEENPRHDVEEEIPAQCRASEPENCKHDEEGENKNRRLQHIAQDGQHGIAMRFANAVNNRMINQFDNVQRARKGGFGGGLLKHYLRTPYMLGN